MPWAVGQVCEALASLTPALPEIRIIPTQGTQGWVGRASATLWWSDLGSACERLVSLLCPLQHYTSDADGLCTRLIKPKVMEGTVAAQDEFFRSEWHPIPSLHLPARLLLPRLLGIAPSQRLWRPARVCTHDRPVGRGEPCDSAPASAPLTAPLPVPQVAGR